MPAWFSNAITNNNTIKTCVYHWSEFHIASNQAVHIKSITALLPGAKYLLVAVLATFSLKVFALDTGLGIYTELKYGKNPTRSHAGQQSDLAKTVGANLELLHLDPRNTVSIQYDAAYTDYERNRLKDDAGYRGKTTLARSLVSNTLNWYVFHSHSERVSDIRDADTQDNRRTIEYYASGPSLSLNITDVDTLHTSVLYQKTRFGQPENSSLIESDVDADNDGYAARAAWTHAISKTSQVALGYNFAESEYSDIDFTVKRHQYFAGYASRLRIGRYAIFLGGSRIDPENSGSREGGYANVSFKTYSDQGSHLEINLGHEISDTGAASNVNTPILTGNNFSQLNNPAGQFRQTDSISDFSTIDTVKNTDFNVKYERPVCTNCALSLEYYYNRADFSDNSNPAQNTDDRTGHRYELGFDYQHSERLKSFIGARYQPIDVDDDQTKANRRDERYIATLGSDWDFSKKMLLEARIYWEERKSNRDDAEYEAPAVSIRLNYMIDELEQR